VTILPPAEAPESDVRLDVLSLMATGAPQDVCTQLTGLLGERLGMVIATVLTDPTGKHLLVAGLVGLAPTAATIEIDAADHDNVVARCTATATRWESSPGKAIHWLDGVAEPINAVVPISLPSRPTRGAHPHGAIVLFGDRRLGDDDAIMFVELTAKLIAMAIELDLERRDVVQHSIDVESGLPDARHLFDHLEKVRKDPLISGHAAVYRVKVRPGQFRSPRDGDLKRDDLARIGAILQQCLRPGDMVAHLGDGDFAVVAVEMAASGDAPSLTMRMLDSIAGIAPDSDHPVGVYNAEVGGTDMDGLQDAATLLSEADRARRESSDDHGLARRSARLLAHPVASESSVAVDDLVRALKDGRIQPWYQPLFELASVNTVAVEALARWVEPDGRLISPGEFIPAVQEHGLMSRLTSSMLRQVIGDVAAWHNAGQLPSGFKASVNISMSDLTGGLLPAIVGSLLSEYGLDAEMLCLELTETEAMADVDHSLAMLHQLRDLGVGLSIDDFGTGYSSLSYLSQLPVDIVKIDRAFVQGLSTRRGDEAIIGAVVDVADAVGLIVLAEGIETEEELDRLRSLGVKMGQGFLVSPAIRPEALLEHLEAQHT
jgi:EAL domain-containing protein (putative c-di-GMP-specific phosphodiesterase class I)